MSTRNPFKRVAAYATGGRYAAEPAGSSQAISPDATGTTDASTLGGDHGDAKHGPEDPFRDGQATSSTMPGALEEGESSTSHAVNDTTTTMRNLSVTTQPPALPPRRASADYSPPDSPQAPSPTASVPPHTPPRTPTPTARSPPSASGPPPPLPPRQPSSAAAAPVYASPSSPPPGVSSALHAGGATNTHTSPPPPRSPPPPSFMSIDEEPPEYTPAPDYHQGEETLELGPARPFQRPQPTGQSYHGWSPQPRPQNTGPYLSPHPTGPILSPHATGPYGSLRQSSSLLGQLAAVVDRALDNISTPPGASYPGYGQHPPPPPGPMRPPQPPRPPQASRPHQSQSLHPQQTGTRPQSAGGTPQTDFARDFYAAGANGVPAEGDSGAGSASRSDGAHGGGPAPDLRPTTTPTPGRPLLREGRVLVYPAGVECRKCDNTGYKDMDPGRPCGRCWRKYARQYEGPLTYAEFGPTGDGRLQRPLRPPPPAHPQQPPSVRRQHTGAPGAAYRGPHGSLGGRPMPPGRPPMPPGRPPMPPGRPPMPPGPPHMHRPSYSTGYARAPPGTVVYAPGDPRIGGALCWRCGGRGSVTAFFGLDEDTCGACGGIGRVFR
ncbi:hypothetical protein BD626DRAFT_512555 [Schizophyllum amplum]|uniref:Uncharacterized protein n=1 Tax=Schizophyllum amplum TaxID=97359 RepID=A0A550C084_9AGAR|nr:hypothetical protein BD626DRAFT_512555 [Auriculariopsis ampla]